MAILGMSIFSTATVVAVIDLLVFHGTLNQVLAYFDATLLCFYGAIEQHRKRSGT